MSRKKKVPEPYRSKFEERVATDLKRRRVRFKYESVKIDYTVPESRHKYIPDFELPNGVLVEVKGLLDAAARKKMALIKEQNPEKDIRILFLRDQPIRKGSETMYSDWAKKHGYQYAFKDVPTEWLK